MIDFVELASTVENYILIVFMMLVNHVGFIRMSFKKSLSCCITLCYLVLTFERLSGKKYLTTKEPKAFTKDSQSK